MKTKRLVEVVFSQHKGFCWNSRRWLFKFIMEAPPRCVYREQGNKECAHEECAYYEEREFTRNAALDYEAFAAMAAVKP